MKKPYSLDFSIEKDTERVAAVAQILDSLEKNPSDTELEQMASYILYGKDDDGYNAVQRGEVTNGNTRYSTYRRKDDKLLSLDELIENPMTDERELQTTLKRSVYNNKKPTINRPKFDKKTGAMTDPGDSIVPGMIELWERIDRIEHQLAVLEGKLPPDESVTVWLDSYRIYQLKHILVDLRRHQYYLKDSYNPTLHFPGADHPKQQFVDWDSDCFYWLPYDQWSTRVTTSLLPISKNLEDYETEERPDGLYVKWIVARHTFDWENVAHVRALINNYDALYDQLYEKLDTCGRTLIFDFERYREMCHFTEVRSFLLDLKIARMPYPQIAQALQEKFGLTYNENHISTIVSKEIPQAFADVAAKHRLILDTPKEQLKTCYRCGNSYPRHKLFFTKNRTRKDGFSSSCKDCERLARIQKGGQTTYDRRSKEAALHTMQARET